MKELEERVEAYKSLYQCFCEKRTFDPSVSGQMTPFTRAAVYGTLSYYYAIDHLVKKTTERDVSGFDGATATVIRLGAWQILFSNKVPSYAAVNTSVELSKKFCPDSKGLVNFVLHKIADLESIDLREYKPDVRTSLKPELYGILKKCYGKERALSIGDAFLDKKAELTVRFDPEKVEKDELKRMLMADDFKVRDGHFMDEALVIEPGKVTIAGSSAFKKGLFFVQGEAEMLASRVADPKKGDLILDCCSAPGGKATHMAELTGDDSDIRAFDISPERAKRIDENTGRLGIKSVRSGVSDMTEAAFDEMFDIVTADVPCSGMGLLGRRPDIRYLLDYERICDLTGIQKRIMDNVSRFVKTGGIFVYSTCSVNSDENEHQVRRFLEEHPDFEACDVTGYLPQRLKKDEERLDLAGHGIVRLLPDEDPCDGFFICRMRRIR